MSGRHRKETTEPQHTSVGESDVADVSPIAPSRADVGEQSSGDDSGMGETGGEASTQRD